MLNLALVFSQPKYSEKQVFLRKKRVKQSEKMAKIKWACRRGMLELDFILIEFLESKLLTLSEEEQDALLLFLENSDPDLYSWLMGYKEPQSDADINMTCMIRNSR